MLEQSLLFTGFSSIQFLNSPLFLNIVSQNTFGTLPLTVQYLCDLQDVMPLHWSPCTSAHILSLLATSLIHNSGLILICVKTMNILLAVKISVKQQFEAVDLLQLFKKYRSSQSEANLSIYQNFSPPPSKKKRSFPKLLPQKMHFQNCSLKKYIFKIASSKIYFQNCFLKKYHFKVPLSKNCSLKKYIFRITPSKNVFKIALFKTALSKKTILKWLPKKDFSKLLSQKLFFQNCFLKTH